MKKIIIGCGILFVLGAGFVFLMFYMISRPKFRDVSKEQPFSEIVKNKIRTKRKTLIVQYPGIPINENYVYHLEDGSSFGIDSDLEKLEEIAVDTEITIDKIELHTGRVSGTTSAYLFGKVYSEETQQEYAFQYSWGNYHSLQEDNPYWTFELAFWQDEPLAKKYFIEVP
ncbi:MAG: hypothetical protein AB8B59_11285 [Maribacter sp.]